MKTVCIGSGAAWFLIGVHVAITRNETASVIPFGVATVLLVLASTVFKDAPRYKVPTLKELAVLIVLVAGAFCYVAGPAMFLKWLVVVAIIGIFRLMSTTREERIRAGLEP